MTEKLTDKRAAELSKFLADTKKSYTRKQLAEKFKWAEHPQTFNTVITAINEMGLLEIDEIRKPFYYSHKKGATPNFFKPFTFTDEIQKEIDLRTPSNAQYSKTAAWILPETEFENNLIFALVFGLGLDESDDQIKYEEFANAVAAKYRRVSIAYRLACSFIKLTRRERGPKALEKLGISWIKEDFTDMRLVYRDLFDKLLGEDNGPV